MTYMHIHPKRVEYSQGIRPSDNITVTCREYSDLESQRILYSKLLPLRPRQACLCLLIVTRNEEHITREGRKCQYEKCYFPFYHGAKLRKKTEIKQKREKKSEKKPPSPQKMRLYLSTISIRKKKKRQPKSANPTRLKLLYKCH